MSEEAERGDEIALQICNEITRWLSAAISKYVDLFEPNLLILGGYAPDVASELLHSQVHAPLAIVSHTGTDGAGTAVRSLVRVAPAGLGRDATLVGVVTPLF